MSFCTRDDVVDRTGTSLNDNILGQQTLDRIIKGSDRLINRNIVKAGLTADPSPTPDDLMQASTYRLPRFLIGTWLTAPYHKNIQPKDSKKRQMSPQSLKIIMQLVWRL